MLSRKSASDFGQRGTRLLGAKNTHRKPFLYQLGIASFALRVAHSFLGRQPKQLRARKPTEANARWSEAAREKAVPRDSSSRGLSTIYANIL